MPTIKFVQNYSRTVDNINTAIRIATEIATEFDSYQINCRTTIKSKIDQSADTTEYTVSATITDPIVIDSDTEFEFDPADSDNRTGYYSEFQPDFIDRLNSIE